METRKIKISTEGLLAFLQRMTDEDYTKHMILGGLNTRQKAINYLTLLIKEGNNWIE